MKDIQANRLAKHTGNYIYESELIPISNTPVRNWLAGQSASQQVAEAGGDGGMDIII